MGLGSSPKNVNTLQLKTTRNIHVIEKLGLLLQLGRTLTMGNHGCLSRGVLGRTSCRFGGGSKEALDWVLSESRGKSMNASLSKSYL